MNKVVMQSANDLISKIHQVFNHDLALQNDYLRQENKILRSKLGKRVPLSEDDRKVLVRCGLPIKDRLDEVMSIVRPETLLAWHRRMKKDKWTFDNRPKKPPGRPPTPDPTEQLTIKIARENRQMGYVRITGELKKLGRDVSASTVANILKKHGLPPAPRRQGLPWKMFLQSHLPVAWAADFFYRRSLDRQRPGHLLRLVLYSPRHPARSYRRLHAQSQRRLDEATSQKLFHET